MPALDTQSARLGMLGRRAIGSVRIHAGHGDVVMALSGLQALKEIGAEFIAPQAGIFTRTDSRALAHVLMPEYGIATLAESAHAPHPRYVIVQHTSWTTTLRNWLTRDFYVNFPERRLLASFGYPPAGLALRIQDALTHLRYGGSLDWRRETPAYYGVRIWAPLARTLGYSDTDVMRGLHLAHGRFAQRLAAHVAQLPDGAHSIPTVALFPSGGGFQYFPAAFTRRLLDQADLGAGEYVCYFGPKDTTIAEYRAFGIRCDVSGTTDDMLRIVARAPVTVTADSFVSHVAQHLAPRHVALMSHDLPQHTVHPAARSRVIYAAQPCCPCYYHLRREAKLCMVGRPYCGVFDMADYLTDAAAAIREACRAAGRAR